jgi:alpha-ketoglutarate-dependent taurine dioxygenase
VALHLALMPGGPPLLHAPALGSAPAAWAAEHREEVRRIVLREGALLLRGLGVGTPEDVERIAGALMTRRVVEREAFARRRRHADGIYSSSEWPPDEAMCMHHELSYAVEIPSLLLFGCLGAPVTGGATAVADSHAVLQSLPPALVARFERDGWLLTRNYHQVGLSWADAFGTTDRTAVDRYCRGNAIEHEWRASGGLRTRQRRAAVVRHPASGQPVWFNQVAFLSAWTLDPPIREYLVETYGRDELPYDTRYGDGQPIEADVVRTINDVYQAAALREPWRDGDLLLVDNLRMAHSREPFEGPREVVVAMGDPVRLSGHALAAPAVTDGAEMR